jgi:predicted XRE-type DNA-binding protein
MDQTKRKKLEEAGWRVGSSAEFLELTPEEAEYVELKLALGDYLRDLRRQHRWTQTQVARQLGSSQSRVAKMEAADISVTLDLIVKSLLKLGASPGDLGRAIGGTA